MFMTKHLHKLTIMVAALLLVSFTGYGQAKDLPFNDNFESYTDHQEFVDNSGWTLIDADGDGNNWYLYFDTVDQINVLASDSWLDDVALTPDNYLITPQLKIPVLGTGASVMLNYDVAAGGKNYYEEKYKIVVSTGGNLKVDFDAGDILHEEVLTSLESDWAFAARSIDLTAYADSDIYIAFVHFDSTDNDRLLINNVSVEVIEHSLPFVENFNAYENTPDFLDNSGWKTVDEDGDGENWFLYAIGENKVMASESYAGGALTPENYLITPQITLPQEATGETILLTYNIAATGNNYYEENYKVVVSVTGNDVADFIDDNIVKEETLTQAEAGSRLAFRAVDLTDFAGESIYLAFVHYDCTDQDMLLLDNVEVKVVNSAVIFPGVAEFNPLDPEDVTTTIYWFGATEVSGITAGTDNLVAGTDFTVTVVDSETSQLEVHPVFLAEVEDEKVELVISFNTGDPVTLTVNIAATPDAATVSPQMADFDPASPADVTTTITWGDASSVTEIKAGDVVLDPAYYEVTGDVLSLKAAWFADKTPGYIVFNISFDLGDDTFFVARIFEDAVKVLPFAESFMGMPELGGQTPEEWLPNGWTSVDADDDGFNWYYIPIMENNEISFGRMQSRSYYEDDDGTEVTLYPDNWLFSPPIQLNPITAEDQEIELTFMVAPGAGTPRFRKENYSVLISYTDMNPDSFVELFTETLQETHPQNELQERKVELTFYEGQTVYMAFRHHDSADNDRLFLAHVKITMPGLTGIYPTDDLLVKVYPNPARDFLRVESDVNIRQISLIGIMGNIVSQELVSNNRYELNLGHLAEGTYILKAETEKGTVVRRIQIIK
jgi:hypothetical protein